MTTLSLFGETWEDSHKKASAETLKASSKSKQAYRTISEVAKDMGVASHVLRFWESKFSEIQPLRRGGGRRYYRPEDIQILKNIQYFLHHEGYTIKGVQSLVKREGEHVLLQDVSLMPAVQKKSQEEVSIKNTETPVSQTALLEELYSIRKLLSER